MPDMSSTDRTPPILTSAKDAFEKHLPHGTAIFYATTLSLTALFVLLFLLNIVESIFQAAVPFKLVIGIYGIAAFCGVVGWRYGEFQSK